MARDPRAIMGPRRGASGLLAFAAVVAAAMAPAARASAIEPAAAAPSGAATKPWCGPDVAELEDHVCFADGGAAPSGRRTLVVYLHGMLAATPGFQYVQQRMMARQATSLRFTLLMPTSPRTDAGYWWPSGATQKEAEPDIVAGILRERGELEARLGARFDETFVVGFSSGAYYASSLALRGALAVDGYVVLAGGSSWMRPAASTLRVPVFVGVSGKDAQTAEHSRAFAGTLAALRWPYRVEERAVGHEVDAVFLAHALGWLRSRTKGEIR
jgi:hypothetical protein